MMLVKRLVLYILFQFAFLAMSAQYTLKGVISDADGNFYARGDHYCAA